MTSLIGALDADARLLRASFAILECRDIGDDVHRAIGGAIEGDLPIGSSDQVAHGTCRARRRRRRPRNPRGHAARVYEDFNLGNGAVAILNRRRGDDLDNVVALRRRPAPARDGTGDLNATGGIGATAAAAGERDIDHRNLVRRNIETSRACTSACRELDTVAIGDRKIPEENGDDAAVTGHVDLVSLRFEATLALDHCGNAVDGHTAHLQCEFH